MIKKFQPSNTTFSCNPTFHIECRNYYKTKPFYYLRTLIQSSKLRYEISRNLSTQVQLFDVRKYSNYLIEVVKSYCVLKFQNVLLHLDVPNIYVLSHFWSDMYFVCKIM